MILIGDIHGLFHDYKQILKIYNIKKSLQLGDMGVGFSPELVLDLNGIKGDHKFIRGNHDNPFVCREHPCYAGDYGIIEGDFIDGMFTKLFFVSGAWSIDKDLRTPDKDWWEEEELSYKDLSAAVNFYFKEKPDIVCTHDCPTSVLFELHRTVVPTRTAQAFDSMLLHHQPSYWFFGHHHMSWRKRIDGCMFVCLNELEVLNISKRI